ncbi:MAG: hypothetical protein QNK11_00530 [Legionella sp.]|nr:hypothetical protein [Legionella sp.]
MPLTAEERCASITRLPPEKWESYSPFLLGNDTPLTNEQVVAHKINKNFALVGTALFRSIDIACQLAHDENVFPTVIIVDNSKEVSEAWSKIKRFFSEKEEEEDHAEDIMDFSMDELTDVIITSAVGSMIQGIDPPQFFENFFNRYSLAYIQRVIAEVVVIEQDWGDTNTFKAIQEAFKTIPIAVYASNIPSYVPSEAQPGVLASIAALKPCVTFCTNFHEVKRKPTASYVFLDSSPHVIANELGLSFEVEAITQKNLTEKNTSSVDRLPVTNDETSDLKDREPKEQFKRRLEAITGAESKENIKPKIEPK